MTDSGFALDDNFVYGSLSTSKELYTGTAFLRNYLCTCHITATINFTIVAYVIIRHRYSWPTNMIEMRGIKLRDIESSQRYLPPTKLTWKDRAPLVTRDRTYSRPSENLLMEHSPYPSQSELLLI